MSAQIKKEHKDYYGMLERTQKGTVDVTPWMEWFLGCLGRAIDGAQETLGAVLDKKRNLNVINRLLDRFEGKLTTSKYAAQAKCSQDTAHRDILILIEQGLLAAFAYLADGADTARAAVFAGAVGDEISGGAQEAILHFEERLAAADATGIVVVEIKIGPVVAGGLGGILGKGDAQVAGIAHEQQRRDGAEWLDPGYELLLR